MTSGVANMSKELVLGTVDKYDWVQLAVAIKHPEYGKIIDLNDDVRKTTELKMLMLNFTRPTGMGTLIVYVS